MGDDTIHSPRDIVENGGLIPMTGSIHAFHHKKRTRAETQRANRISLEYTIHDTVMRETQRTIPADPFRGSPRRRPYRQPGVVPPPSATCPRLSIPRIAGPETVGKVSQMTPEVQRRGEANTITSALLCTGNTRRGRTDPWSADVCPQPAS